MMLYTICSSELFLFSIIMNKNYGKYNGKVKL